MGFRRPVLALALVVIAFCGALAGCRVTDIGLWSVLKDPNLRPPFGVREIADVAYYEGAAHDRVRHRCDVYLPVDREDDHYRLSAGDQPYVPQKFPVVVLVHGGAWMVGDNRCCGLYSSVGKYFASRGVAVVMPNYRLAPQVRHPDHVKDVARAVAWTRKTFREESDKFRGHRVDPDRLVLMGHSAGGHLVSLLATDDQYLKAERVDPKSVRGVISVSGVYDIPPGKVDVSVGGQGPLAVHLDTAIPIRGETKKAWVQLSGPGLPVSVNIFGPPFGDDPEVRAAASPIKHVRPGLPPFLIFTAEHDLPLLTNQANDFHAALADAATNRGRFRSTLQWPEVPKIEFRSMAADLDVALAQVGGVSQLVRVHQRNHNSIVFSACKSDDPVAALSLAFVEKVAPASK